MSPGNPLLENRESGQTPDSSADGTRTKTTDRQSLTAHPNMDRHDDEEEFGFYQRYRYFIWIGILVVLAGAITFAIRTFTTNQPASKAQPVTFVKLLPSVPTPTPPPPAQSTPRPQEMIEQKQMMEPETKPVHPDEKPKEDNKKQAPPGPLGVNAKGEGQSDAFGLVGRPGGNGLLNGGGGGGGTRFGWYAAQVQSRIEQALRENNRTRNASIPGLRVRIWADNTGRVTRAQLIGSTGDSSIDSAITNEVLNGMQLQQPPPSDMPMPIVLRVTAHRPS